MKLEKRNSNKQVYSIDNITEDKAYIDILAKYRHILMNVPSTHILGVSTNNIADLLLDHEVLSFVTLLRSSLCFRTISDKYYNSVILHLPAGEVTLDTLLTRLGSVFTIADRGDKAFSFTLSREISITLHTYSFTKGNAISAPLESVMPSVVLDATTSALIIKSYDNLTDGEFLAFDSTASVLDLRVTPTRVVMVIPTNYTLGDLVETAQSTLAYEFELLKECGALF